MNKAHVVLPRKEEEEAQKGLVRVQGMWAGPQEQAQALRAQEGEEVKLSYNPVRRTPLT
ncbi:MAG: hypothetical protein JSW51_11975 [Gemmatimonadota bacterium]|nr:MAG: hypothetical protein JSW51_11975 [Gemmatimonadota bacterium]